VSGQYDKTTLQTGKILIYKIIIMIFLPLIVDQITKYSAITMCEFSAIEVFSFMNIAVAYNHGIAFSMFSHDSRASQIFVLCMSISSLSYVIYYLYKHCVFDNSFHTIRSLMPICFIIAGGLSNIICRLTRGFVIDFIDLHYCEYHFPTFNIADTMILLSVICILLQRKHRENKTD
jgi:signal peptidase II